MLAQSVKPALQPLGGRGRAGAVAARAAAGRGGEEQREVAQPERVAHALLAVAAISAASCVVTQPAAAWGAKWRPRRHHRRLGEWERQPDLGKYSTEAMASRKQAAPAEAEGQGFMRQLGGWGDNLKHTLAHQEQKVAASKRARQVYEVAQASSPAITVGGRSFSPLTAGALAVGALLLGRWLFGLVRMAQLRSSETRPGRWVRDRGLGGKMVFIPDEEVAPRAAGGGDEAVAAAAPAAAAQAAAAAAPEGAIAPAWWAPPPAIYVEPGFRREIQAEAQAIASRVVNSKVVGQDFDVGSLVTIRQLCADTGATIDTRPHTDAIYRFAADAAANSAAEQSSELGGQLPGRFLSGLALDLGIEEAEAVNMVSATVASRARAALITACAGYREGDNNEVLVQLLKLAGLVTALPLPPRSPHAEMVATGIQQRASLQERQAIFLTYGCMDPASADKVAELLGFEPALVLPQLEKHIAEGKSRVAALA